MSSRHRTALFMLLFMPSEYNPRLPLAVLGFASLSMSIIPCWLMVGRRKWLGRLAFRKVAPPFPHPFGFFSWPSVHYRLLPPPHLGVCTFPEVRLHRGAFARHHLFTPHFYKMRPANANAFTTQRASNAPHGCPFGQIQLIHHTI